MPLNLQQILESLRYMARLLEMRDRVEGMSQDSLVWRLKVEDQIEALESEINRHTAAD
jgi:hypothetical protein